MERSGRFFRPDTFTKSIAALTLRMKSPIPFLRTLGHVEAISFLLLLGIAMPLKYVAGMPQAVKVVGWAHGVLFVALGMALLRTMLVAKWSLGRGALVFAAAFVPFGPFLLDRRMAQYEEEFQNRFKGSGKSAAPSPVLK